MKRALKILSISIFSAALIGSGILFTAGKSADNYFQIAKNIDIFNTLYKQINVYYVDETKPGKLIKTAIDAMLDSLDPYTVFYPESDIEDYKFMTTGQYGGIGALIRTVDNHVVIAEPYENFPAQKAGLRAGDRIITVDGDTAIGKNSSEMSKVLKGQPGTKLEMVVDRPGSDQYLEVEVIREEVKIDEVPYYGKVKEGVGYIKLNSFTETASSNVKKALVDLKENEGVKSVILDLRGNGGGLLREAVNIVNLFVPKGTEVVYTKGKNEEWNRSHRTINDPVDLEIPLTVLIDGSSASASEIVAGTIQDLDRGVVIGQNSFGKGLVQQTKDLSYNTKMKVTVAKYYIPSGRCIQRLDYSHKDEDGKATEVPDSLRKEFETENGRTVLDGAGIEPDIKVENQKASPILQVLLGKSLIFDYATHFRNENDTIPQASTFQLSDKQYADFEKWLSSKEYEYTTRTEKMLEKLEEATKKEKYYNEIKDSYAELKQKMHHNKAKDLKTFRDQIDKVLENEIASRYYYQKGRIQASLNEDDDVAKAIEVLNNNEKYSGILTVSAK
ncbi:S41 family peptidase [Salibacter sp.]|uniref:S41 family peptidase n=1 Tax=Salibacter sp. TaxID=2010995 RepID=UPI0028708404|nr:S41 family peptidase [Salibacter sp.]MDR9398831.1 S41 family peptidase [Salibacter sp.]MDR9487379.1 S41 family peptidase [Salibacter sp.]